MKYRVVLLFLVTSSIGGNPSSIQAQVFDKIKLLDFAKSSFNHPKLINPFRLPVIYESANFKAAQAVKTNQVWGGGVSGLDLSGDGITIGYWDQNQPLLSHQEYTGRVSFLDSEAGSNNGHATNMVGTMIATGLNTDARGMANEAIVSAWNWNDDISEMAVEAANGLIVSAHPYQATAGWANNSNICGSGWMWFSLESVDSTKAFQFGYYNNQAQYWDSVAYLAPDYLIIKAAGNQRGEGPDNQPIIHWKYDSSFNCVQDSLSVREIDGGANGFESINAASLSKNVLVVGAVESTSNNFEDLDSIVPTSNSGFGPTDDGRLKPDIVAPTQLLTSSVSGNTSYGTGGGTSAATAVVAGSVALIQEHYQALHSDTLSSATLRALLAHSADDVGNKGPDFKTGWGLLNTERAVRFISANNTGAVSQIIIDSVLVSGGTLNFSFNHTSNRPLMVTVAWTDPAASPSTNTNDPTDLKLINDLDLSIEGPDGNNYSPWILDRINPDLEATTGVNNVDNIEQIEITESKKGNYSISLAHKGTLVNGSQRFSLLISEKEPNLEFKTVADGNWSSGSIWEAGVVPSAAYHSAIINHSISLDQDVEIRGFSFNSMSGLLSLNGNSLTVSDGFKNLSAENGLAADSLSDLLINGWSSDSDSLQFTRGLNHLKQLTINAPDDTVTIISEIEISDQLSLEKGVLDIRSASLVLMADSSNSASLFISGGELIGDLHYSKEFYKTDAGWRMISIPFEGELFSTLNENFHTQGGDWATYQVPENESNLWFYDSDDQNYVGYSGTDSLFTPGSGYLFYMFEGGKSLVVKGQEPDSLSINLFRGSEDSLSYNLVGNPFAGTLDWHQVIDDSENLSPSYAVWNPAGISGGGTSGFKYYNAESGLGLAGRYLAPLQGFFVQTMDENANISFRQSNKTTAQPIIYGKKVDDQPDHIRFILTSWNREILDDQAYLVFSENGDKGKDLHDVARIKSLSGATNQVSFLGEENEELVFEGRSSNSTTDTVKIVIELDKPGLYQLNWEFIGDYINDFQYYIRDLKSQKSWNINTMNNLPIQIDKADKSFYELVIHRNSVTASDDELPSKLNLHQNYPNPFNPVTIISYHLPKSAKVKLEIFDINGRLIETVVNTVQEQGRYSQLFNANGMSSGVYFYRLSVGEKIETKKMILIK